ncbi:MAG TPA: DUF447 family protein [Pirellulaceae bacterium]|nr:DUF447 family protein [Pirellulaceae bacterium]HMO92700.1 DUF447 family protein [Pirellulaceae bacterium]HMP70379.1 DUF447 family protein [Pirellulaceae bacterium]
MTTRNALGETNIAPMGMVVDRGDYRFLELRPFQSTTTYRNLIEKPHGVAHISDDCGLVARAALGLPLKDLKFLPGKCLDVDILADACYCHEFTVVHFDHASPRANLICHIEATHRFRDFIGFNRAAFAIIECSILATRLEFLPRSDVQNKLHEFKKVVIKTGGAQEQDVFKQIEEFIDLRYRDFASTEECAHEG